MSNRFTEKAEKALNGAVSIAETLGHTYIGSEHILLSLLSEKTSSASIILNKCGSNYEKIKNTVKDYSGFGIKSSLTPKDMTPRSRKIVENSYKISLRYGASKIGTEHLLLSILEEKESVGVKILTLAGVDTVNVSDELITLLRSAEKNFELKYERKNSTEPALTQYGRNLTKEFAGDNHDPIIGREKETERLIRILCRKSKNNPCLIGEAGVGKTAIVEGLAHRIANGKVPIQLSGKTIISVDLTSMVAGAKYRGDFEERIKNMINEASKNKSIILFIDEIHTIVGAGSAEGAIDAANILKPQLSRAEIQLIGATTFDEYHKYIKKDAALDRRFQSLIIEEPTHKETVNILNGLKERYEAHHNVIINDKAIESAVSLAERYIQDKFLPDKALDVLDEACAKTSVLNAHKKDEKTKQILANERNLDLNSKGFENEQLINDAGFDFNKRFEVSETEIKDIVNEMTGIPISGLSHKITYDNLYNALCKKVIGQNEAIKSLSMTIIRSEAGITNPDRPKGVFLFSGPSGVGKTALAKALSEYLFLDKNSIIKYDMSEFSEKNSVTKLIGSPPGYIGYEKGGALTEKIRRHPYSVVLFDEMEKAHEEVLNLFLQIMDEGVLTDSLGRTASFKNAYIIMTTNLADSNLREHSVGFTGEKNKNIILDQLKDKFPMEFLNRVDNILPFSSIELEDMEIITEQKLDLLCERLRETSIELLYDFHVVAYLSEKAKKEKLGVRAIERLISNEIENTVSLRILSGYIGAIKISINEKHDGLMFENIGEKEKKKSPAGMQDSLG